jgi:hypothetical protein
MVSCPDGWTSLGDFSFERGNSERECLVNFRAVRIMSYFCVIIPSISSILIVWHYRKLAIRKKTCFVISWKYKTLFPFFYLILGISSAIFGVLKVSYRDGNQPLVGRDFTISLMVFFSTSSCFFGMIIYLHVIIHFLIGHSIMMTFESRERVSNYFLLLGFYSWFILPIAVISSIMPLMAVAYPSRSKELGIVHLITFAVLIYIYGLIFSNLVTFLLKELNVYVDSVQEYISKDIKLVVYRLNLAYFVVFGASLLFGTLYLIFGSSYYLFHLTTYFQLVTYTIVPAISYAHVMTVALISPSDSDQIIPTNRDEKTIENHPTFFMRLLSYTSVGNQSPGSPINSNFE